MPSHNFLAKTCMNGEWQNDLFFRSNLYNFRLATNFWETYSLCVKCIYFIPREILLAYCWDWIQVPARNNLWSKQSPSELAGPSCFIRLFQMIFFQSILCRGRKSDFVYTPNYPILINLDYNILSMVTNICESFLSSWNSYKVIPT